MKFAVPVFPGSNCDRNMYNVAIKTGIEAEYVGYRKASLNGFDGILIPGDSLFDDHLRSEAMASVTPTISGVERFVNEDKPTLGVYNGFQILAKIRLLPGVLLHNDSHLLISRNEKLKIVNDQTPFTDLYGGNEITVYPITHREGYYYCTDDMHNESAGNNQTILTYEDNPNGSHEHVAGIVSKAGNVYGMMPHPERALKTLLDTDSGVELFKAMVNSWREQNA